MIRKKSTSTVVQSARALLLLLIASTLGLAGCGGSAAYMSEDISYENQAASLQPQEQIIGRWRCVSSTIGGESSPIGVELQFFWDGTFRSSVPGARFEQIGEYQFINDGQAIEIFFRGASRTQVRNVSFEGDTLIMNGVALDGNWNSFEFTNEYERME